MKKKKKRNNRTYFSIIIGLILIIVTLAFVLLFISNITGIKKGDNKVVDTTTYKKNPALKYKNIIYKVRYDFGAEDYIYLLPNNVIKMVEVQLVYEVQPDCNCMIPTGETSYTEQTINFSKNSTDKIIRVLDELYETSGRREFNTDDMELTEYQNRMLLAVILNDEDTITIEDNIKYNKKKGKMILDNSTDNIIVNKIADYLNNKVEVDFSKNENAKNTIELVYVGPYSISFVYTLDVNGVKYSNGYSFNYNGDLRDNNIGGIKDSIISSAKNEFMNSDFYKTYYLQLYTNWESVFEYNLFKTGNWYFDDKLIKFFVSVEDLGINNSLVKVVEIKVPLNENI